MPRAEVRARALPRTKFMAEVKLTRWDGGTKESLVLRVVQFEFADGERFPAGQVEPYEPSPKDWYASYDLCHWDAIIVIQLVGVAG